MPDHIAELCTFTKSAAGGRRTDRWSTWRSIGARNRSQNVDTHPAARARYRLCYVQIEICERGKLNLLRILINL